jgi:hypothetical protein
MIAEIKKYMEKCPLLNNGKVKVDYIGEEMSYSIDPLPCDPVVKKYLDGGLKKQYQFAFTSNELYDEDARVNIDNSEFCQKFEEWLEEQNQLENLPKLEGNKESIELETLNKGYLYDTDGAYGRYRIECRLLYSQII